MVRCCIKIFSSLGFTTWRRHHKIKIPVYKGAFCCFILYSYITMHVGQENAVGIATCYGLDGPGLESRLRRDFLQPSRLGLGPTQPPIQWVPGLSRGESSRGVVLTTPPPSSTEVKERVELYLYCPSGPSWPVLGWLYLYLITLHSAKNI